MTDTVEISETSTVSTTNWLLRIAKWAGLALLGLVVLVALLVFGLNTGPGKRLVVDQIEAFEMESGMKVGIGRIEGSLYSAMTIHDLSLSDPTGVFLTSPQVEVDWRPFAFISSHVDVRSATAETMTLLRLPELNETPPSEDPLLPDLDIDVGELRIDQFIAEAPVAGERQVASLAGDAHIAAGRAEVTFTGIATQGGDRIDLVLDAVPEDNKLALDLDLQAPGGGIIAAMAGLTEPLAVTLKGSGDWAKWDGRLDADLAGSGLADLQLAARDGTFSAKGETQIARMFAGPTAALIGPVAAIDLTATPVDRRVNLVASFLSDALRVDADGVVDLAESGFDGLQVAAQVLQPSALAENLQGGGLLAELELDGAFATPTVDYTITASRIVMNDMGLKNLTATGAATIDADRILIPIEARVGRITGLDTVAGGTLENVSLDGDLAIEGTRILSDNLQIRSDRIDAKLIVVADVGTGLYTGAVDGRIDDYRIESAGVFDITTDIDLETEREGFALAGRVGVRSTQLTNEGVRNFLGGNVTAATDIRYGSDGTARFRNLTLRSPLVRINGGSGSYAANGQLTLNANAMTEQYGAVGVRVAGTITDPRATITAENPNFGIGLANLTADITGAPGGYRLDAKADTDYGLLTADVVLGMGDQLTLDITQANLGGIAFDGSLAQTAAGPFAGRLNASGNGFDGVVRLGAQGQYQEALVNLRALNASLPGPLQVSIGSAKIDARVVLYDTPHVVADARLTQTRYGELYLGAARAEVDYRDGSGTAKVVAEGTSGIPFRIAANAQMQPDLWRAALNGRARGVEFRTTSPARIIPRNGEYELLPTNIDFGRGSMRLAGTYGEGMKLQSRLDSLDVSLVNAFMPGLGLNGRATGSLDFAQSNPNAFPSADARLTITNFTRTTAASVSQPVNINFVGDLLPNGGEARAVIRRRGTVIGRFNASLSPLGPAAGPWMTRLMQAPLQGGVRYNGPAETLFSLAGQGDQTLTGAIGVAADFSCRVADPCLEGVVRANNLTYENLTYGTRLSNMVLQGNFSGNRLEIDRLQATAGDGTVNASGFFSLSADSGYLMDLNMVFEDAHLARGDMIDATATGELNLTKTAGASALLAGNISLPETRYAITVSGVAEVPTLTGVRFKPPVGPERITGDEVAETAPGLLAELRLDIDLNAPEKLYVSGMGLESEWSANFNVTGTALEPRMAGTVELVRGTLGFSGRSFEITEGLVRFTGGRTLDPILQIVASDDIDDVTVNVNVTGRAFDPQIAFSSSPGLPQDEIVSRILFGNSVGDLSPIQAVQLAASLNSLRGSGGGGLNPLGTLRAATGIDRLRILGADEASGRGAALAAGQYLTDDIYVELITDARGFTATQLEVSLTPALSILSQAGGANGTDVNVQYRKNY